MEERDAVLLQARIDGLRGLPPSLIKPASRALGRVFSLTYGIPRAGPALMKGFAAFASFLLVKAGIMGLRRVPGGDPVEIAFRWMRFPALMCTPCEVAEASDERVVLLWPECPVGYRGAEKAGLCRAVMEIDRKTVERMGGEMTIAETVLEGALCCRYVFTPAKPGNDDGSARHMRPGAPGGCAIRKRRR